MALSNYFDNVHWDVWIPAKVGIHAVRVYGNLTLSSYAVSYGKIIKNQNPYRVGEQGANLTVGNRNAEPIVFCHGSDEPGRGAL